MVEYGNASAFVRLLIKLETLGPVPVIVGKGVVLLIGESTRGPTAEAVAMTSATYAKTYYHSGDLKDAIELCFGQGAPVVYAIRVLGDHSATATITIEDGQGNDVVIANASSPGIWGNSVRIKVLAGSFKATETVTMKPGTGTAGPYYTKMQNMLNDGSNWIEVDGVERTIVYTGVPGTDEVLLETTGRFTFNASQPILNSQLITYALKYQTIKVEITDNEITQSFDNLHNITQLIAKLHGTGLVEITAIAGETHLPALGTYILTGGSQGQAITTTNWRTAMRTGGEQAAELIGAPQCAAITDYEVEEGTHDLIPEIDAQSMELANKFHPCQWFVSTAPNMSLASLLDLASGYSNRLLTIIANGWDGSTVPKCIAVARAGKEAACALGESAALPRNAMNGLNGLLNSFSQAEVDTMTQDTDARLDCIIKSRGLRPYVGITTDSTWQFLRTVDQRTINYVIVASNEIAKQFFHEKRTDRVMNSMKNSWQSVLEGLRRDECIRAYTISVGPHDTDTGKVLVHINMENIGHIERIDETLAIGILPSVASRFTATAGTTMEA